MSFFSFYFHGSLSITFHNILKTQQEWRPNVEEIAKFLLKNIHVLRILPLSAGGLIYGDNTENCFDRYASSLTTSLQEGHRSLKTFKLFLAFPAQYISFDLKNLLSF